MIYIIAELFTCIIEGFLIYVFENSFSPLKNRKNFWIPIAIFIAANFILTHFVESAMIRMILLTICLIIVTLHCFVSTFWQAFVLAIVFSAFSIISDIICLGLLNMLNIPSDLILSNTKYRIAYIIVAKIAHLCIILVVSSTGKYGLLNLPFSKILPLSLCQVFSIFCCFFLFQFAIEENFKHPIMLVFSLLGLLYLNAVVYIYFHIVKNNLETTQEKQLAEHQLQIQLEYYENIRADQERTRSMWHDMKGHIDVITALVDSNNKPALACINELKEKFSGIGNLANLENPIINAILNNGLQKCNTHSIKVVLQAFVAPELNISPLSLSTIIGNTFENSIRACAELTDETIPKEIQITLRQKNQLLLYEIENPYEKLSIQKHRPGIHGYGLQNVKEYVAKNNGTIDITQSNNRFRVSIMLNV